MIQEAARRGSKKAGSLLEIHLQDYIQSHAVTIVNVHKLPNT